MTTAGALSGLKIVDLAGPPGFYGTKLLADLGADVVRLESADEWPDPGPFLPTGQSLYRYHFHTNKRSVAVDLTSPQGRETLRRLLSRADVLVESYSRSEADALSLDPESVGAAYPSLIHVSITNFGPAGPYVDYKAGDLVAQAMGGLMSITGFPEDRPVRVGAEQAYHSAGLHAAVGTMLAIHQRAADGQGRHVEIAMQDAVSMAILQTANFNFYTILGLIPSRAGNEPRIAMQRGSRSPAVFRCSDGWIVYTTPPQPPHLWTNFVHWLEEHGAASDLADPKYDDPEVRTADAAHVVEVQQAFFATLSCSVLYHEAQRYGLLCMPVQTVEDLVADAQLQARRYFVEVDHPELERVVKYPGAPYQLSGTPFAIHRRAPLLGEDGAAVLSDWLDLSPDECDRLLLDPLPERAR